MDDWQTRFSHDFGQTGATLDSNLKPNTLSTPAKFAFFGYRATGGMLPSYERSKTGNSPSIPSQVAGAALGAVPAVAMGAVGLVAGIGLDIGKAVIFSGRKINQATGSHCCASKPKKQGVTAEEFIRSQQQKP